VLGLGDRLRTAGLDVIEVTTTIDGWDTVIETIRERDPEVCVGAGTVTTPRRSHQE
jgi:2-keto-3-deoxy-6-phosphogluconate aldolase